MATFYVDYENVHHGGTVGIDELTNSEYVFLFYSQNANTMNMDTVKHFLGSRCGIEFVEADTGTTNALDFQLVTFLFSKLTFTLEVVGIVLTTKTITSPLSF